MATRNIVLQTKRLNKKKLDLSLEESGRAIPNIEADAHFSLSCIASLASQLRLLTKLELFCHCMQALWIDSVL